MKIYDCILYNGEEIIDLRLELYNKIVNYFIILECDRSFQGNKKKFTFNVNKYPNIKKKIIYIKKNCPEIINFSTVWDFEFYQRNSLIDGFKKYSDDDFFILGDVDEIILPKKLIFNKRKIYLYELLNLRFYGNYLCKDSPFFTHSITASCKLAKEFGMQNLRMSYKSLKKNLGNKNIYDEYKKKIAYTPVQKIIDAGFHFSSLKKKNLSLTDTINLKHSQYSHIEFNNEEYNNKKIINFKINSGIDLYNQGYRWDFFKINYKSKIIKEWLKKNNLIIDSNVSTKIINFKMIRKRKDIVNNLINFFVLVFHKIILFFFKKL
jgi:beta-1,4-mannosyl-glycoprotein beta-1,4-N-acetylglucosaminyltransferase